MARSVGIPARVVSGWTVGATPDTQTVSLDQAHQWAEVAFEGLGWVTFEPTASGGPFDRALEDPETEQAEEAAEEPTPPAPPEPPKPRETVIEITQWPTEVERDFTFSIGGTVQTHSGEPVSGVEVELFINETKEHGGTLIGEAVAWTAFSSPRSCCPCPWSGATIS